MSDINFKNIGDPTTLLIEECSEVIKELCKVQRFGWDNYHPADKSRTPNFLRVLNEIKDLEDRIGLVKKLIEENFGEMSENRFVQGFICACAAMYQAYGDDNMAINMLSSCCQVSIDVYIKSGVDENDINILRPVIEQITKMSQTDHVKT